MHETLSNSISDEIESIVTKFFLKMEFAGKMSVIVLLLYRTTRRTSIPVVALLLYRMVSYQLCFRKKKELKLEVPTVKLRDSILRYWYRKKLNLSKKMYRTYVRTYDGAISNIHPMKKKDMNLSQKNGYCISERK